jgi:hypothetical protein
MRLLSLLIPSILSHKSLQIKIGYTKLTLLHHADLHLNLPSGGRAFIIASSDFLINSVIRVTTNHSSQDFLGRRISGPAISIFGDSATIFYTGDGDSVHAQIWIIESPACEDRALFINHDGGYQLNLTSNDISCVFSIGPHADLVEFGGRSFGASLTTINGTVLKCPKEYCNSTVDSPYYAIFPWSSHIVLREIDNERGVKFCSTGFFTPIAIGSSREIQSWNPNVVVDCRPKLFNEIFAFILIFVYGLGLICSLPSLRNWCLRWAEDQQPGHMGVIRRVDYW